MNYILSSKFSGFMDQTGNLYINITQGPSTILNINSNTSGIFTTDSCLSCTNIYLNLQGIVKYFTSVTIPISGVLNNIIYASGNITVSYPCNSGCQICNATSCLKCLNSTYTSNIYYFNGSCLTACPSVTYLDSTTCIPCQANCYICNASQCLNCTNTYIYYNGSCIANCPTGYIISNNTCLLQPIICPLICSGCIS